ncbi:MAG: NAD-binding protein, partial [Cyanobacteria bacterium J06641_2]
FLGRQFASKGYQLTIITSDEKQALSLSRKLKATVIKGDGSSPQILQDAGAYSADVLLALTAQDQDNLVACQVAQDRYGVPRTIALVNDPDNREVFQKLGVTQAFSATEILGSLIEQQADVQDIKNLLPVADTEVTLTEMTLQNDSPAVEKTPEQLNLNGAAIACIIRGRTVLQAKEYSRLRSGDRLILISQSNQCANAQRLIMGEKV